MAISPKFAHAILLGTSKPAVHTIELCKFLWLSLPGTKVTWEVWRLTKLRLRLWVATNLARPWLYLSCGSPFPFPFPFPFPLFHPPGCVPTLGWGGWGGAGYGDVTDIIISFISPRGGHLVVFKKTLPAVLCKRRPSYRTEIRGQSSGTVNGLTPPIWDLPPPPPRHQNKNGLITLNSPNLWIWRGNNNTIFRQSLGTKYNHGIQAQL